ncbi:MAG: Alkaline phosphatase synthesis transcriptional regulatory protein PhoP [Anaerolineales bacterium]|nr:Alkaline phosphatase synthesis transcriptional regulatory protein PhoP [Anaerolineales bacterium]
MNPTGRILIIDDEAALRQTLARILQRAGHTVSTAESGALGLSLLANTAFDLVHLDIRMPDMNGLEILKTIHASHPELPVILFTAQPDLNSALEALRLGASDYLLKPLQPEVLLERTRAALARRVKDRRKREIQSQIEALQTELKNLEADEATPPSADATRHPERFLSRGNLILDLLARRVSVGGRAVDLPPTAFDYLLVLARHAPNLVDYQTLVAEAQGYTAAPREAQELVKWHIHHIRQAIEPDSQKPVYIINVRGAGYRFVGE